MTAPHGRGDAPSHPIEAPSTEAARALLDAPDVLLMQSGDEIIGINEGELELQLAAIEAAARDEGRQEAVRDARRLVERHTDAKESRDSGDHCTWECYIPTFDDFDHEVAGLNVSESPPTSWPGNTATIQHTDPRRSDVGDASESGQQEQSDD